MFSYCDRRQTSVHYSRPRQHRLAVCWTSDQLASHQRCRYYYLVHSFRSAAHIRRLRLLRHSFHQVFLFSGYTWLYCCLHFNLRELPETAVAVTDPEISFRVTNLRTKWLIGRFWVSFRGFIANHCIFGNYCLQRVHEWLLHSVSAWRHMWLANGMHLSHLIFPACYNVSVGQSISQEVLKCLVA